jgi:hypothetical protein
MGHWRLAVVAGAACGGNDRGHALFRYWRPTVHRSALLVGFGKRQATFCATYRQIARIAMPVANEERGEPIEHRLLTDDLPALWPTLVSRLS